MLLNTDTLLSFRDAITRYLDFLIGVRRASPHTVNAYRTDLRQYEAWMREHEMVQTVNGSDATMLSRYALHLKSSGYSTATQARKIAALKALYKFCRAMDYSDLDQSDHLGRPRVLNALPEILSQDSIETLMAATESTDQPYRSRDKAMLETIYATGLRVSELLGLNIGDIDFDAQLLRCYGKGSKERIVPLHDQAVAQLDNYILTARTALTRSDTPKAVFLNRFGKRLSRQGFWQIVKAYAKKANLVHDISPHTLRHSFATHMIEGGAPISYVQQMLGHSNVSTTEVYNHVANDYLREEFETAHPRGSLRDGR